MSLKKYMILDLVILTVIGCIIEAVGILACNKMLTCNMIASAVSLLMMVVATTRWGWKGLFIAPFLALATIISGRFFNPHDEFKVMYEWKFYISILLSLLSIGVNLIWFKFINYKETFKQVKYVLLLGTIDIIVSQVVLTLVYFALMQQFLFLAFLIWNACSYVLLLVGMFILKRQNVLIDVKQSLIEKNKEVKDVDFRMDLPEDEENELDIEEKIEKKGDFNNGEGC